MVIHFHTAYEAVFGVFFAWFPKEIWSTHFFTKMFLLKGSNLLSLN